MQKKYADQVQFLVVYIKEAHPADGLPMPGSRRVRYVKDPESVFERFQVASTCVRDLEISIPCLIDDMENTAARAYKAHPDRLYVVGKDGKIAYHGAPGPRGFRPEHMEPALRFELIRIGAIAPPGD